MSLSAMYILLLIDYDLLTLIFLSCDNFPFSPSGRRASLTPSSKSILPSSFEIDEDEEIERSSNALIADLAADAEKQRRVAEMHKERLLAEHAAAADRKQNQQLASRLVEEERRRRIEEENDVHRAEDAYRKASVALAVELSDAEKSSRVHEWENESDAAKLDSNRARHENQLLAVKLSEMEKQERVEHSTPRKASSKYRQALNEKL